MPLPLPNLDTRRWADLVDEGRALIPRYAPGWSDHNIHDPGITLIELLAWLVEGDIYRVNRVPDRHRRKFLALAGYAPQPPRPAQVALTFSLAGAAGNQTIPAGLTVATGNGRRFRTLTSLTIIPVAIQAVQVFDGQSFTNQTRLWRDGLPFPLFGPNPAPAADPAVQPALYLGFDQALPPGTSLLPHEAVTLWFWPAEGRTDMEERPRIIQEAQDNRAYCQPLRPLRTCVSVPPPADAWCPQEEEETLLPPTDEAAGEPTLPPHHAMRTIWEYDDGSAWQPLNPAAGEVADDTRSFTLDGAVRLVLPGNMGARPVGTVSEPYFYLRCRLAAGRPDAAPLLADLALNTAPAEQASPARSTLTIAPGVTPPDEQKPVVGQRQRLRLALDGAGIITDLAVESAGDGPEVLILDYQAADAATPGRLVATLALAGQGTGLPGQTVTLPGAPVANGRVRLWTATLTGLEPWWLRPDLDASKRTDAGFTLNPTAGQVAFGNGERGRSAPAGAAILAVYDTTAGVAGNLAAKVTWSLLGADDTLNRALLGGDVAPLDNALAHIANRHPAGGGADEETLNHAAGRAAEALWAHERLLELCPPGPCPTLDQLDRTVVLARAAPARAVTLLDYERLALDTPGVRVQRARAWAGLDPHYSCLQSPGTVTVVVVPGLPLGRPEPGRELLQVVFASLNRRRVIGTRLVVVGPEYLVVSVRATVRPKAGADPTRVRAQILSALNAFLDPLQGGPGGRGWPFGRDVYRAEILQVIDQVAGVNHVLRLELIPDQGEAQCGNLCVGPTTLVTSGAHFIDVKTQGGQGMEVIRDGW